MTAADTTQAIVRSTDLRRWFGTGEATVKALDGVTIGFAPGEFTAIVGPSGSGKSTLMHCLAGLDRPTSGEVIIDGQQLTGLKDAALTKLRRERLGFIFQSFNLLPVLSARENIELPLRLGRSDPDQAWIDELLQATGLTNRASHRPAELSGGQQQRVAIARALVTRPAVVFADEPTGNLDSHSSQEILDLLRHSVDTYGQTLVMVTHDPRAAARADRLVALADGKVVHDGPAPDDVDAMLDLMKEIGR
ncbi:MAG: ABC transporter ATP-binding protein [Solirubrobacteraceae bacterium]|nr:ABC transporter ATP-binding protein [Solirubrobacteraceae bacterium]